jgi:hypothetical protein
MVVYTPERPAPPADTPANYAAVRDAALNVAVNHLFMITPMTLEQVLSLSGFQNPRDYILSSVISLARMRVYRGLQARGMLTMGKQGDDGLRPADLDFLLSDLVYQLQAELQADTPTPSPSGEN